MIVKARLVAFLRLSRLHFLAGGLLMFAIGAFATRKPDWQTYLLAQLMVSSAQLTAHYVNEYADFDADSIIENRTNFSGGSGVLQSGIFDQKIALKAALTTTALCVCTSALIAIHHPIAALLGLLALTVSWAYSMPPVRLLSTGTGEIFTSLTVAGLVPAIGSQIANHSLPHQLVWCITALSLMHMSMLLAFEVPDLTTDELAGKRVLGVRIGAASTRLLIITFSVLAEITVLFAYLSGQITGVTLFAAFAVIPLIALTMTFVHKRHFALLTFVSVATFFLLGAGFLVAELKQGSL